MRRISANTILKFIVLLGLVAFICYWAGFAVKEAKLKLFELGFNNASEKRTQELKSFILDGKAQLENNDTICFSELCIGDEVNKVLNNGSFQKIYIEPTSLPPVDRVFLKSYLANSVPKDEARILSSYVQDGEGWYANDYVIDNAGWYTNNHEQNGDLMVFGFSKKLIQALPSLKFKDSLVSNTKDDRFPTLISSTLSLDTNQDRFTKHLSYLAPPFVLSKEFALVDLEFISKFSNTNRKLIKPVLKTIFFALDLPAQSASEEAAINLKRQIIETYKLQQIDSSRTNISLYQSTVNSLEVYLTDLKASDGQTIKVYLQEIVYCKPPKGSLGCSNTKNNRYHLQLVAGNGFERWYLLDTLILTPGILMKK